MTYTSAHHPECNEIHQNFSAPCNFALNPHVIEYNRQHPGQSHPSADWAPTAPAVGPYGVEYFKRATFTDTSDVERWIETGDPTGRTRETTTRDELDKLEASIARDKAREAAKADSTPTTPTEMPGGLIEADRIVMQDLNAGIEGAIEDMKAAGTLPPPRGSRPSSKQTSSEPSTPTETPGQPRDSSNAEDTAPKTSQQQARSSVADEGGTMTTGYTSAHHPECNKKHRGFAAPCNRELSPGVIEYKHHRALRAEANRRRAEANRRRADAQLEALMPPIPLRRRFPFRRSHTAGCRR